MDNLGDIGDDGFGIVIGNLGQKVVLNTAVDAELNLLRVNEHNLHLSRVLLI